MGYILMVISVTAKVTSKALSNYAGKNLLKTTGDFYRCNLVMMAICFVLFTCLSISKGISAFSLLLGLVFGAVILINNTYYLRALSVGPMNITDLIATSSMLISAMSGVILYNETFSISKLIATIFLILFIYLTIKPAKGGAKANKKWLFYCLIAFITQGGIGVIQKVHQSSAYKGELFGFLAVAFMVSLVSSVFATKKSRPEKRMGAKEYVTFSIQGICMFLMHFLNLKLSGMFPSQFFFPVSAGSGIIFVLLISAFVFKERLSVRQTIGLLGGFASILCIGML